ADLWFGLGDVPDWPSIRERISDELDILEDVGAVSVVGDGLGEDPARVERTRQVAREAGVDIVAMSTSPLRVSLFCREAEVDHLVRACHRAVVEAGRS